MPPIIVTEQLTKLFKISQGEFTAVDHVSLEVNQGELFGLFGTNGAGKTTIVRILATLLHPTSGRAWVNGYDVVQDEIKVRASIGLVTAEERSFYGRLTARENLTFYAAMQNIPYRQTGRAADEVLALFGLTDHAHRIFQSLSTGQKQRLNMARALIHNPQVIFLDEPTKSMDVQTSDFVKHLIKDELVEARGKTVVFISHELYEMDNFCDRVMILANGRVQALGTPAELSARLPRQAAYRVVFEGNPDHIAAQWRCLSKVQEITEISRGISLSTFHVTLTEEKSEVWLALLQVVADCGGRVETYERVDDGSLRHIVKYFSAQDTDQQEEKAPNGYLNA